MIVLGEHVDLAFGAGAALVLAGITLVSVPSLRREPGRRARRRDLTVSSYT